MSHHNQPQSSTPWTTALPVEPDDAPRSTSIHPDLVPLATLMAGQVPAWYPDPVGPHSERFWNGTSWTDQGRIAIPVLSIDGSFACEEPLRLADLVEPIEPILLEAIAIMA